MKPVMNARRGGTDWIIGNRSPYRPDDPVPPHGPRKAPKGPGDRKVRPYTGPRPFSLAARRVLWPPKGTEGDCSCTVCVDAAAHNAGTATIQQATPGSSPPVAASYTWGASFATAPSGFVVGIQVSGSFVSIERTFIVVTPPTNADNVAVAFGVAVGITGTVAFPRPDEENVVLTRVRWRLRRRSTCKRFSRPQLATTGDSVWASRARSQRPSGCLRYMVIL